MHRRSDGRQSRRPRPSPRRSPGASSARRTDDSSGARRPISIPSSRAHPSSTAASGTTWPRRRTRRPRTPRRVEPSIVMTRPAASTRAADRRRPRRRRPRRRAPTTAGIPQPRATTAAWLAKPPVDGQDPAARCMPCTSSGEVSARTRIDVRPRVGGRDRVLGRQADLAAARRPARPRGPRVSASTGVGALGHGRGRVGEDARRPAAPPPRASSGKPGSSAISTAIRRAACGRPLADPDLEHPEPALLDRELDVAAVAVVALERGPRSGAARAATAGMRASRTDDRLGRVRARDDVLALGVEQDVAVEGVLAGRRVAREQHARPGVRAAVAEHHRLDRDARAQVVADPLELAVGTGPVAVPGAEHGLDRAAQLRPTGPRARRRRRRRRGRSCGSGRGSRARRPGPPEAAASPASVAWLRPEVEDRVHHPGHRPRRARTGPTPGAGRPGRRTGGRPCASRAAMCVPDLVVQAVRPAAREVRVAGLGRDRERRRDRQAQVHGHRGDVRRLAAEEQRDLGRARSWR